MNIRIVRLLKPTLRKVTEVGIGVTAIATLILAGCGGGGGAASGTPSSTPVATSAASSVTAATTTATSSVTPATTTAAASSVTTTTAASSATPAATVAGLMGGSMQSTPLVLTTAVTTFAGSGNGGSLDGTGTLSSFWKPNGICTDGTNLFVADTDNNVIRKIVISTGVVTTFAGSGSTIYANGFGTAASITYPAGITTDGINLYVITNLAVIRKIVIATGEVTLLAGGGTSAVFPQMGFSDGTGKSAKFFGPEGITTDGTNVYVADTVNSKIRKIVIATGVVTTIATPAITSYGITTDGVNLYVTDSGNLVVRKIVIATGAISTLAGSGAYGKADGVGSAASFLYPQGITTDGTNLYMTDSDIIRKINIATGAVTTVAGAGAAALVNGIGTLATFNAPAGITTDGANLFVSDTVNNVIRKIQ